MKPNSILAADNHFYGASGVRRRGMVVGVAVSLALHALLIFGWRYALAPAASERGRTTDMLTVWLRPAPPRLVPEPPETAAQVVPPKPVSAHVHEKHEPKPPAANSNIVAAQPPAAPAPAQAITLPAPAQDQHATLAPAQPAPKFDMEAALKTARAMADEPDDPARANTVAGQIDKHPLYPRSTESRLAREIDSAKRPDCKDGVPGGLLAPLFLLMDKKDSGCKW